jgi:AcrR family transcriptional regulator
MKSSPAARRPYESPLREEQAAATRTRILEATAALLADEHPAALSMPAVAARAGVAIRTVYRNFPTKELLLEALYDWSVERLMGAELPEHSGVDDLVSRMPGIFQVVHDNRDFYRAMHNSGMGREVRDQKGEERKAGIMRVLRGSTKTMTKAEARRLGALAHLLTWSNTALFLGEYWDMSPQEAAQACGWALETLVKAAAKKKGAAR